MAMPVKPLTFPTVELPQLNGAGSAPSIGNAPSVAKTPGTPGIAKAEQSDFGTALRDALHDVNSQQMKADKFASDYASGKQNDLHGTMITIAEADVQLRLTSQIRSKLIDAYREIMRMGS